MVEFKSLRGDLYVRESAEEADQINSEMEDVLYTQAVFKSKNIDIRFYAGIGGYIPVKEDESIVNEYGDEIYYPFVNETVCEVAINSSQNLELFKENVCLFYVMIEGDMYIASQSGTGSHYFVQHENIYKILGSMLTPPVDSFDEDEFLGISSVDEPVMVKNVATGATNPIEMSVVEDVLEKNKNGALKVQEPDAVLTQAYNQLRDD